MKLRGNVCQDNLENTSEASHQPIRLTPPCYRSLSKKGGGVETNYQTILTKPFFDSLFQFLSNN